MRVETHYGGGWGVPTPIRVWSKSWMMEEVRTKPISKSDIGSSEKSDVQLNQPAINSCERASLSRPKEC